MILRVVVVVTLALACAACPSNAIVDAGAPALVDAGAPAIVDAGAASAAVVDNVPLSPAPLAFRFVRMRAPTLAGEEILRISLDERARIVDGTPELRSAPSPEALARLVAACADPAVRAVLRKPGDTAPAMTIIELGCEPVTGVIACAPNAPCGAAFDEVRAAVATAWDEELVEPEAGIRLQTTAWSGASTQPIERNVVMSVNGKPLLPAKGEPFARAPSGKRVTLCTDGNTTCTEVVSPSLVHLDVVGNTNRFRCATCVTVAPARAPPGPPDLPPRAPSAVLATVKGAIPGMQKRCGQLKGPKEFSMHWVIEASGTVSGVQPANVTPSPRERCAAAEIGRMRFPAARDAVPTTFPLRIGR